ncbi:ImmA/IrrE family metallo-endopeptidase [Vibrio splendidus]
MTTSKFDSLIVNGDAGNSSSSRDIFESFIESQAQFESLPAKLKTDPNTVKLNLLREVHSRKSSAPLFRKQENTNTALINYWLSRVKNLAHLSLAMNEIPKFEGLTKQDLTEFAKGNVEPEYLKKIELDLADRGIIFIAEPSVDGLKTDGAVFKLKTGHPVVAMSLRYKRLDNFWFTLMHELSHVALHYEQLDNYIIDDLDSTSEDIVELEADKLAGDSLIPRHIWRTCHARRDLKEASLIAFSKQHGIHPAIVAGRIQNERGDYRTFSSLTNKFDTREILFHE